MSFNTSHVAIYQQAFERIEEILKFQYISCCYLSAASLKDTADGAKFQYISCCYLSSICVLFCTPPGHVSIHLMLLFILSVWGTCVLPWGVSIHLMLLFIGFFQLDEKTGVSFNTSHVAIYLTTLRCFPFLLSLIFLYFSSFSSFFTSRTHFFIFSPKILCFSHNQGFYSGFLFFPTW